MTNRIFISYATGDDENVVKLYDSLSRLENVEVFVPEYADQGSENTSLKIKQALDGSDVSIILLTFNSTNTMWLNQEIGYSVAKNIPVILVIERGLDVVGFLKGSDYVIYQRGDFEQNIYEIIVTLRSILQNRESRVSNFYVVCTKCKNKFLEPLLPQDLVDKKLKKGEKITCQCNLCHSTLLIDPMTLSTSV